MANRYGRFALNHRAKPSTNPASDFTELFTDSANGGKYTVLHPNGTTVCLEDLVNHANSLVVTPAGNISATNAQDALEELDTEKVAKSGDTMTGRLTGTSITMTTDITNNGQTLYGITNVSAGATISIPITGSVVRILDDGASAANALTIPDGTDGQVLIIINLDASSVSGSGIYIPSMEVHQIMYVITGEDPDEHTPVGSWIDISYGRVTP